jgi:hypothetical protein
MRKFILTISIALSFQVNAQELSYYLPQDISYNPAVPKPADVIGHEVGEWHVTHDRLVNYMKAMATAAPDRIKLEQTGTTFETRPQLLLIITAKKNLDKLEELRRQHLLLSDGAISSSLAIEQMPVVVWMGHSIHGNESSGANASLLEIYYLAAAQGRDIEELLENIIVLFDPSFNPDGLQRFSTWVNQHKSKNLVTDANSREFNEVWPGGRFNHYWFDLNRDWLPAIQPESQNRLKKFQDWRPNILTDHHEQGSNASFFFQPGVASRVNPLTPEKNQELTARIAAFHAKALDKIGSLYFTKENYDDFYYGKGSTYPDVQGCIGILFEQASSRGHAQQTANGILRFPFTIRNQFTTALSTLEAAKSLRTELLNYQRDYFKMTAQEGAAANKVWIVGDTYDKAKTNHFIEMLLRHKIEVHELNAPITSGERTFEKSTSYIIPSRQPQYRLLKAIFDKTLNYKDSIFYDITAWTMPLAFGLPLAEIDMPQLTPNAIGVKIERTSQAVGAIAGDKSNYGYVFEWNELYAPRLLYELIDNGVLAKVATAPFSTTTSAGTKKFNYGAILIPVGLQSKDADKVYATLKQLAIKNGIIIHSVHSGLSATGIDLGSSKWAAIAKPTVALLVGAGVSALDAGEIWYTLDQRFGIPLSHLEVPVLNRVELNKYNTLILVSGNYSDINKEKIKTWIQNGGTLICLEDAVKWAADAGITNIVFKKSNTSSDSTGRMSYAQLENTSGAQENNGAIFRATVDLTHPLAYGMNYPSIDLFKAGKNFLLKSKNPYATPFYYGDKPLQSGYIFKGNYEAIKNSAAVIVSTVGSGRVISIADNPNFRGFWLGANKLMMNAVFFGRIIDAASGRMAADE